ncbi:uncharacterized protein TNCV_2980391 [Trichonephila clavipes]|nr:uncharacterized protein TNCV_2980391 [Trichonephila clavipes]
MSRSGGQSEARPPVFKSPSKLGTHLSTLCKPHHLSQCLDPADDLDGVFFHPELPVHVNKQTDLPAYLKQLALERIGDYQLTQFKFIRMAVDRSGSRIYIKSQDHILRIQTAFSSGQLVC